jgi:hypothetical protein
MLLKYTYRSNLLQLGVGAKNVPKKHATNTNGIEGLMLAELTRNCGKIKKKVCDAGVLSRGCVESPPLLFWRLSGSQLVRGFLPGGRMPIEASPAAHHGVEGKHTAKKIRIRY